MDRELLYINIQFTKMLKESNRLRPSKFGRKSTFRFISNIWSVSLLVSFLFSLSGRPFLKMPSKSLKFDRFSFVTEAIPLLQIHQSSWRVLRPQQPEQLRERAVSSRSEELEQDDWGWAGRDRSLPERSWCLK